jgi:hypothetical protein
MAQTTGSAPPERVCPNCSTLARTTEQRCPFCRRSYYRGGSGTVAGLLAVAVIVVLAGTAAMLFFSLETLEGELDRQVNEVQADLERQLRDLEGVVSDEFDQRFGRGPAG